MPIFRERELTSCSARAPPAFCWSPAAFRGRNYEAMALGLRSAAGARASDRAGRHDPPDRRAGAGDCPGPRPDQIDAAAFHLGDLGRAQGRAASPRGAHARRRRPHRPFRAGGDDVVYVPSPLAHQTGFLYGMWIALRLGAPQVLQEIWDAARARRHAAASASPLSRPPRHSWPTWSGWPGAGRGGAGASLRKFVATGAAIPRELARAGPRSSTARSGAPGARPRAVWERVRARRMRPSGPGPPTADPSPGVEVRIVDDSGAPCSR